MPVSPEAHLISSVLNCRDFKTAIGHGVTADMFHTHQEEWQWMEDYFRRYRKSPTRAAFRAKFSDFRIYKTEDTAYFADEVRKSHARHELVQYMSDVADLLSTGDVDAAVKRMGSAVVSVAARIGKDVDTDIFSDYNAIFREVEARYHRMQEHGSAGIPTGIPAIDNRTGGLNPGEFIVFGARLGQGKSWMLQKVAANAAAHGNVVVFDALEQSRAQVGIRIHSLLSTTVGMSVFKSTALMQGKDFDLKEYKKFLRKLKENMRGRLHVSDASRGRVSPLTVAAQIERHQPNIVFIDYIGLMSTSSPDWQGYSQLSSDLKVLATTYAIPVVAAAQLNRERGTTGREPADPDALARSDAIGQDADMVITQKQISRSVLMMKMAKNRNGPGGFKWYMQFQPDAGIIQEVSFSKAMDLMDADKDAEDAEMDREERGLRK